MHLELAPVRLDQSTERLATPAPRQRQQVTGGLPHGGFFSVVLPHKQVDTTSGGN
jgi:hypothetical protein